MKQEQTKEFKQLKWKYFWQQKFQKVGIFLVSTILLVFLPYLVGIFLIMIPGFGPSENVTSLYTIILCKWVLGFIFIMITFIPAYWIKCNLNQAKEISHAELKVKGGKKRKDGN